VGVVLRAQPDERTLAHERDRVCPGDPDGRGHGPTKLAAQCVLRLNPPAHAPSLTPPPPPPRKVAEYGCPLAELDTSLALSAAHLCMCLCLCLPTRCTVRPSPVFAARRVFFPFLFLPITPCVVRPPHHAAPAARARPRRTVGPRVAGRGGANRCRWGR
jgi:hypothetical protein